MANITQDLIAREQEVRKYIELYSKMFEVDPDLVRGLITQESAFIADAQSPTGAFGYGQFTGIGARQVQNIADLNPNAADLADFEKREASDPNRGIKAICATLWWLFKVKYAKISDKKLQLEAALTFYNAGGRPAAVVIKYGSHKEALEALKLLPANQRSQSVEYAPRIAAWFIAWHDYMLDKQITSTNPFDESKHKLDNKYRVLIEAILLLDKEDSLIDTILNVRDGLTELTLIFPGEYE